MNGEKRYLSFLLRLWQESAADQPGTGALLWRASLQSTQSDERQTYAGPEELFTYLREQMGIAPPANGSEKGQQAVRSISREPKR